MGKKYMYTPEQRKQNEAASGLVVGARVIDVSARKNGHPDKIGRIQTIIGANICIVYEDGSKKWQIAKNVEVVSNA